MIQGAANNRRVIITLSLLLCIGCIVSSFVFTSENYGDFDPRLADFEAPESIDVNVILDGTSSYVFRLTNKNGAQLFILVRHANHPAARVCIVGSLEDARREMDSRPYAANANVEPNTLKLVSILKCYRMRNIGMLSKLKDKSAIYSLDMSISDLSNNMIDSLVFPLKRKLSCYGDSYK
jgi:hypothetical protein